MVDITSIIQANPKISIIIIAAAVAFLSILVTMLFTDRQKMKELRDRQKKCQELMKQHKGDVKKTMEVQKELMACSMEQMKSGFKPMLITFIPFIILFAFIKKVFAATPIASSWFWYYLITAIVASMIFRKILKL